jgi:hypothetical protein
MSNPHPPFHPATLAAAIRSIEALAALVAEVVFAGPEALINGRRRDNVLDYCVSAIADLSDSPSLEHLERAALAIQNAGDDLRRLYEGETQTMVEYLRGNPGRDLSTAYHLLDAADDLFSAILATLKAATASHMAANGTHPEHKKAFLEAIQDDPGLPSGFPFPFPLPSGVRFLRLPFPGAPFPGGDSPSEGDEG